MAVYSMTFSTDDLYLALYYQFVDNYQIRGIRYYLFISYYLVNHDQQGVLCVWDMNQKQFLKNPENLRNVMWKNINFPNSLHAKYIFYQNIIVDEEKKKES